MHLLAKHAGMPRRPDIAARMYLAEAMHQKARADAIEHDAALRPEAVRGGVKRVVRENLRYRIADRITASLDALGLKAATKAAFLKVRSWYQRPA